MQAKASSQMRLHLPLLQQLQAVLQVYAQQALLALVDQLHLSCHHFPACLTC